MKISADGNGERGLERTIKLFIAGGIAGSTAKTVIAPFERTKIIYQVGVPEYPFRGVFPGLFVTMRDIARNEGFRALWKGHVSTITRIFPYASIQFVAFDKYSKALKKTFPSHQSIANFTSGACAGATAVMVTYPLDLVRARLACQVADQVVYRGMLDCMRQMYIAKGIRGLYQGGGPTILGIFPYAGTNFWTYEKLKGFYRSYFKREDISVTGGLVCGGLAGATGQTVTYPLDIVRRRMQTDGMRRGRLYNYQSTKEALSTIWTQYGVRGLFRGLTINYVKVTPMVGISFTTFEYTKKLLRVQ